MVLKRIEIYGFKSFGKKVEIDFNNKVTAIVGPNGSGKSNITDAIRWVMGEQRVKPLRGAKMEDIIFSGTPVKKPLGYAQVSIVLDNSEKIFDTDYDEIEVSRKYFRSGESEYYINKTQCRLKDVQNLFMDTGLGREGYSVVSQGQIESIVVNSPMERKLLIEEAAGIVKYRVRKTDAERKLEKAQNNLYRITDIIAELEQRLPSLKRQSEKAEKFIEYKNQLKEIEVGVFVHRMDILNEKLNKTLFDKQSLEESLKGLDEQFALLDEKYRLIKSKLAEYDSKIIGANEDIHKIMEQFEFAKVDLQVSKKELENLISQKEQFGSEDSNYDFTIKELDKEQKSLIDELNAKNVVLQNVREKFEKHKSKTDEIVSTLRESESKLKILEGYENSMQGYKYAIRELMNLKNTNNILANGLYTTVGEVINTEAVYAEAITKSLGASMSYMITENEHVAAECIGILKKNKWGRVTFLPKNIVKSNEANDNSGIKNCVGFIDYANNLVKTDPEFRGIIDNLLSKVAICDNLENANKAALQTKHRLKIVTLDGEVLYPGGAVAGGQTKNEDEGSIKRRSEIEQLRKVVKDKQKEYDEILTENAKPYEEEIFEIRESVATLKERIRNVEDRKKYFSQVSNKKAEEVLLINKKIDELNQKIVGYSNIDNEYSEQRNKAETYYRTLIAEKEKNNAENDEIDKKIRQISIDRNSVSDKLSSVEVALGKTEVEISHLKDNMMEDYALTYAAAVPYKIEISDLNECLENIAQLKDKIKKLGNINVDALEEYKEVKNRYEEMSLQRDDLIVSKDELYKVINDISESMKKRFIEQFNIIQREFDNVFKKLFNGGEANLVLTDPDDVLNSGVEITARPPNTKLKNIAGLSGGEKSMTAISLIFAILRIKPSPFCVLDEIDAALDDANVGRICEYLQSVLDHNQFVIVTHKKITMEIADTLYGVSMGSEGISQVLSVKLSDIDKYGD